MFIFACELEEWEKEKFIELGRENKVEFCSDNLSEDVAERAREADVLTVFLQPWLGSDLLGRMPKLKLIATRSTGFDHIDLNYCRDHNITVSNVPTYGDITVAEHVFALLLTISHKVTESIERTRRGDFSQAGLMGFDLMGKILGVIGTGAIGQCVIRIALGFGMKVLAFDVRRNEELQRRYDFQYTDMDNLLRRSDIITLHVPATPSTYNLISEVELNKMKNGVVIINTSRGTLIDSKRLVEAVAEGKVAAVGLDVLPEEPVIREEAEMLRSVFRKKYNMENLLADHLLLRLRNVYITPHNAFNTKEAVQRILDVTIDNIRSFGQGKPQNVVNFK